MRPDLPDAFLSGPLYSLVAWPTTTLDAWLRRTQEELGVRSFGVPHLNIRAPFQTDLTATELQAAYRDLLRGQKEFPVRLCGWKRVPHMLFLECQPDPALLHLHRLSLSVQPTSLAPHDGQQYMPHLTLGLGILPWAEDHIWQQVQRLTPPVPGFMVNALSLTREERGEVQELHTFPLTAPRT